MEEQLFAEKINANTITENDPFFKSIIETASQVCLYIFEVEKHTWTRGEANGVFFLYIRKEKPIYNIFILNRLNMTNFIQPISGNMRMEFTEPFLLFQNSCGIIYGLWFYNTEEYKKVKSKIMDILRDRSGGDFDGVKVIENSNNPNVDKEINRRPFGVMSNPTLPSDNVMQFFAKMQMGECKQRTSPPFIPVTNSTISLQSVLNNSHLEENSGMSFDKNQRPVSFTTIPVLSPVSCVSNPIHVEPNDANNQGSHRRLINDNKVIIKSFTPEAFFSDIRNDKSGKSPTRIRNDIKSESDERSANILHHAKLLTKPEFIEAITYLITHDTDFLNKIYDAYVKSRNP